MKNDAELQRYVRSKIDSGEYTQAVAAVVRGDDRWTLLSDQHQQDRRYEADLSTLHGAHPLTATVLNPARNLIARVGVPPPQLEMDLPVGSDSGGMSPAPSPRVIDDTIRSQQKLDLQVCGAINSGRVQTYEQLVALCGSEDELRGSLRRIRRFKDEGVAVQTINGLVEFDPQVLVTRTLRYETKERASVQLKGMEDSRRGRIEVTLRVQRSASTIPVLAERVCLDSVDNHRAVKILQAAQFLELFIEVQLGAEYDLHKQKRFTSLIGFEDESALMVSVGPLMEILESRC